MGTWLSSELGKVKAVRKRSTRPPQLPVRVGSLTAAFPVAINGYVFMCPTGMDVREKYRPFLPSFIASHSWAAPSAQEENYKLNSCLVSFSMIGYDNVNQECYQSTSLLIY